MLGIKGKTVQVYLNGSYSNSISISCGRYSAINFTKTQIRQYDINKYFDTYNTFQNMAIKFNDLQKIDQIRMLMTDINYWWFDEIQNRILSVIKPTNIACFTPTKMICNNTPPNIPRPMFDTGYEFEWDGKTPIFNI
jgi:hypothetical protein